MKTLPHINTSTSADSRAVFGVRDGTVVEKGVVLSLEKMESMADKLEAQMEYYFAYPDRFIDDVLTPSESNFKLLFSQRIFLRAMMRFNAVHLTAARGFSKTFLSVFALILKCIFQPRSIIAITAPSKKQAAEISKDKMQEILTRFPLLRNEIFGEGNYGKDYAVLKEAPALATV